eukprot:18002_2
MAASLSRIRSASRAASTCLPVFRDSSRSTSVITAGSIFFVDSLLFFDFSFFPRLCHFFFGFFLCLLLVGLDIFAVRLGIFLLLGLAFAPRLIHGKALLAVAHFAVEVGAISELRTALRVQSRFAALLCGFVS